MNARTVVAFFCIALLADSALAQGFKGRRTYDFTAKRKVVRKVDQNRHTTVRLIKPVKLRPGQRARFVLPRSHAPRNISALRLLGGQHAAHIVGVSKPRKGPNKGKVLVTVEARRGKTKFGRPMALERGFGLRLGKTHGVRGATGLSYYATVELKAPPAGSGK